MSKVLKEELKDEKIEDVIKELKDLKEFLKAVTPILDILEENTILLEAIMRGDMTDLDVIRKVDKIKKKNK